MLRRQLIDQLAGTLRIVFGVLRYDFTVEVVDVIQIVGPLGNTVGDEDVLLPIVIEILQQDRPTPIGGEGARLQGYIHKGSQPGIDLQVLQRLLRKQSIYTGRK